MVEKQYKVRMNWKNIVSNHEVDDEGFNDVFPFWNLFKYKDEKELEFTVFNKREPKLYKNWFHGVYPPFQYNFHRSWLIFFDDDKDNLFDF